VQVRFLRPILGWTRLGKDMQASTRYNSCLTFVKTLSGLNGNWGHVWKVGRSSSAVSRSASSDRTPWYGETKTSMERWAFCKGHSTPLCSL
jgi:hypothetical protein